MVFMIFIMVNFLITGCPNKFGIRLEMFASEASIVYNKNCILLQKIAFSAFFENC